MSASAGKSALGWLRLWQFWMIAILASVTGCHPTPTDPELVFEQSLEQPALAAGFTHTLRPSKAGIYLIEIFQAGSNVSLHITGPGKEQTYYVDLFRQVRGFETAVVRLDTRNQVSVRLEPVMVTASGSVKFQIYRLPEDTPASRLRVEAEQALADAVRMNRTWNSAVWVQRLKLADRAVQIFAELELHRRYAWGNYLLALIKYGYLQEWAQAVPYAQVASATFEATGDPLTAGWARCLEAAALVEKSKGDTQSQTQEKRDQAHRLVDQQIELFAKLGATTELAWALNLSAAVYYAEQDHEKAIKRYQEAIQTAKKVGANEYLHLAAKNLAIVLDRTGQFARAKEVFQSILASTTPDGQSYLRLLARQELGRTSLKLGHWDDAITNLSHVADNTALPTSDRARNQIQLGFAYLGAGHPDRASVFAEKAAPNLLDVGEAQLFRDHQTLKADIAVAQGRLQDAISIRESLLANAVSRLERADELVQISEIHRLAGQPRESVKSAMEAARIYHSENLQIGQLEALLLAAEGRLQSSPTDLSDVARLIAGARDLMKNAESAPYLVSRLKMASSKLQRVRGNLEEAIELAEESIAALKEVWTHSDTADFRRGFWHRHSAAADYYSRLLAESAASSRSESRQKALFLEADAIRSLALVWEIQGTDSAGEIRQSASSGVLDRLVDDGALVAYALDDPSSYAWVINNNKTQVVQLASRSEITQAVSNAWKTMAVPSTGNQVAKLEEISRLILQPIEAALSHRTVRFIPDGILHLVPFAALPQANGDALIESYEIQRTPYLHAAVLLHRGADTSIAKRQRLLLVGAPTYGSREQTTEGSFPPLPGAGLEIQRVASLLPDRSATVLSGRLATKKMALESLQNQYQYVHFALHGYSDPEFPERSALVFSDEFSTTSAFDRRMTLQDIRKLTLRAELVVLSACESGLGARYRNEAVNGFARAFLVAGADNVLVSLWRIPDEATAMLMAAFYQSLFEGQAAPAQALAAAQRYLRETDEGRWSHPRYWAGWVLYSSADTKGA